MGFDWYAVIGAVFLSLVIMPAVVFYFLVISDGVPLTVIGLLAMLPGFLMGGAALWVAARG